MKPTISTIFALWLLTSIAYAGKHDDLTEYFPMNPGSVWTYQTSNGVPEWQVSVQDCATNNDGINGCSIKSSISPALPPRYDILVIQGDAVLNKATKVIDLYSGNMKDWKQNTPSYMVLRSPLKPGATWENIHENQKERFKILSIKKESVKAGEYEKVLKIKRETYYKDKKSGKWKQCMDGDCNVLQYYAPNVGLIKEEMIDNKRVVLFRQLADYAP